MFGYGSAAATPSSPPALADCARAAEVNMPTAKRAVSARPAIRSLDIRSPLKTNFHLVSIAHARFKIGCDERMTTGLKKQNNCTLVLAIPSYRFGGDGRHAQWSSMQRLKEIAFHMLSHALLLRVTADNPFAANLRSRCFRRNLRAWNARALTADTVRPSRRAVSALVRPCNSRRRTTVRKFSRRCEIA